MLCDKEGPEPWGMTKMRAGLPVNQLGSLKRRFPAASSIVFVGKDLNHHPLAAALQRVPLDTGFTDITSIDSIQEYETPFDNQFFDADAASAGAPVS